MIIRPTCAGKAVHNPVRISGAARVNVFCSENHEPNAPSDHVPVDGERTDPGDALTEKPEQQQRHDQRAQWHEHRFGGGAC